MLKDNFQIIKGDLSVPYCINLTPDSEERIRQLARFLLERIVSEHREKINIKQKANGCSINIKNYVD